jgi:hypothetical protein
MFAAKDYLITIVELKSFQHEADCIFTEEEREALADFIASNPDSGVIIPGSGGVRKLRWRAGGRGKRGGARVIYYFRDLNMPVFLLAVYAKGEKLNLTMAERNAMQRLVDDLVGEYRTHFNSWRASGRSPA